MAIFFRRSTICAPLRIARHCLFSISGLVVTAGGITQDNVVILQNEVTAEAPDHGEKSSVDEECRINKIVLALAGLSLIQHRGQFTFLKIACRCGSVLSGIGESRRGAMLKWHRKVRT